ncbi:MAG: hypothetical protein MMC23_000697 [Stictis urceolatum]|nr:hypothetical protein [Stictis urceolata]
MYFTQAALAAALASVAYGQVSAEQMVQNIDAITDLSSDTRNIAQSISITNFFSTAPQLINNFRQIITIASDDVVSMGDGASSKLRRRQECLDVKDPEQCIEDLKEIVEDPSEILGDKLRKRQDCVDAEDPDKCIEALLQKAIEEAKSSQPKGSEKRGVAATGSISARALSKRQAAPPYDETNQQAICDSFRGFVEVHQELLATVIGKHGILSLTPFTQPIAQVLRTLEGGVDTLAFDIIDTVPDCAKESMQNKNTLDRSLSDAVDTYSN